MLLVPEGRLKKANSIGYLLGNCVWSPPRRTNGGRSWKTCDQYGTNLIRRAENGVLRQSALTLLLN